MADEPTWEDLFGPAEPVKPAAQPTVPVQPAPVQPAPVQPAPVQAAPAAVPTQPAPTQPAPHLAPGFGAPPNLAPAPASPGAHAYPAAPAQASPPVQATQPVQATPPVQARQPVQATPTYAPQSFAGQTTPLSAPPAGATTIPQAVPQQSYVSQLPPAPTRTQTLPPAASRSALAADGGRRGRSDGGGDRPDRPKRKLTWLWVLIVLVVLGAAGAGVIYTAFGPQIRHVLGWEPSVDYTGSGNGQSTTITILPGQLGSDVAASLAKAGVTKTPAAFYDLLLKQKKAPTLYPGTYKLQKQMSAQAALTALINPANRVVSKVVIPEGYNLSQILARLNAKTGVPLSDLQAAAKDYTQFGVPAAAPSLEGFLFPATYDFNPGTTAKVMLQTMVTRMDESLKSHGVAPADDLKVLTLASIIQKEGGTNADFYKVSRVFTNRLAIGMPLQSDATVSYGAGTKTIATTGAQRADASNLYNTYAHTGLPIGPIASPGDTAIDAALHPVAGPWIYFVLVNGYTGETVYSTTAAGQAAGVKQWQAWLKAHPGYGS